MAEDETKYVWAPDVQEGFILGKIVDTNESGDTVSVAIEGTERVIQGPSEYVFNAEDDLTKDHDDNCGLMFLNEATLLHNLRLRYLDDKIYTYVANILIAVNPYKEVPGLGSRETMLKYRGKSLGLLPPHVFAIADKSYRDMRVFKQSQSINVSGESGSGKTESTKYIIRYLTESYGHGGSGNIEKRIVEANPLLEAFGNAKTLRNLNSSRFGKYVEIHFDEKAQIVGAFVSHYLLEKTRICSQSPGDRNYHVFYRMCKGSIPGLSAELKPTDPSQFNYLNQSSLNEPGIDDSQGFDLLDNAMNDVGITLQQKSDIYRIVALVLHLGNIEFQGNKNSGAHVPSTSKPVVSDVALLMGLQPEQIQAAFTSRIMTVQKKTKDRKVSNCKVKLTPEQAIAGRDALAKSIYSKLFDYIVSCVNQCFPFTSSETYIGVLDIAGFEIFDVNRFEQLCINYCNEKLQQFFNERILKDEQRLYMNEGLGIKKITFIDNEDCIELFERRITGIMDLLDDEMKLPTPREQHYTVEVYQKNKGHRRLQVPRKSANAKDRQMKDDEGFLIRHFAGSVCYNTAGFLYRNNDALQDNLEKLLQESTDPFLRNLFPPPEVPVEEGSKKIAFESISKKFRWQLKELMEKLGQTGASFVRCIKPNEKMKSLLFDGGQILRQLQCAGMVSVLHLMQEGYPSRTPFNTLYNKYKNLLPQKLIPSDPRMFCKTLFYALGMDKDDFAFGVTKVFFRPGKFAAFDQLMMASPEFLNQLVKKVVKWIIRYRWRRVIWCAVSVQKCSNKLKWRREMLVRIQKTVRMFLAVRKHKPRYEGIRKLNTIDIQIGELTELVATMPKKSEEYQEIVDEIGPVRDDAIDNVKRTIMTREEIEQIYIDLIEGVDALKQEIEEEIARQEEEERHRRMLRYKWRQVIWCAVSVQKLANKIKMREEMLIRIQSTVRMFLAMRKHQVRIEGLTALVNLGEEINELEELTSELVKKKDVYEEKVSKIRLRTNLITKKFKRTVMNEGEIIELYEDLAGRISTLGEEIQAEIDLEQEEERKAKKLRQMRWKKAIWAAVSVTKCANKIRMRREMLVRIQKTVRMFLAIRKHRHRYEGLLRLKTLDRQVQELIRLLTTLRREREIYEDRLKEIKPLTAQARKKIKGDSTLDEEEIIAEYTELMTKTSELLDQLREESATQKEEERVIKLEQLSKLQLSFLKIGTVGEISRRFEGVREGRRGSKQKIPIEHMSEGVADVRLGRDEVKVNQSKQFYMCTSY